MVYTIFLLALIGFGGWGLTVYLFYTHQNAQRLSTLKDHEDNKTHFRYIIRTTLIDLIDAVPENLVLLDKDGTLMHTNTQAAQRLEHTLDAILRHPQFFLQRDKILTRRTTSFRLSLGFGFMRHFQINMRAASIPHIQTTFIIVSITNWNQQHTLEQTRNDFIANASHELRTPLTTLKGMMETILGPAADDEPTKIRFLEIMSEKIQYMISLTNNLLSLSQLQTSLPNPEKKPLDLMALLGSITEEMRQTFPMIRYHFFSPDKPVLIVANKLHMEQMIRNLLDNATRYAGQKHQHDQTNSDPGTIDIHLHHLLDGKKYKWPENTGTLLTIADNGPGIPLQEIPRLTERFYRADPHSPGSGLGLAIVKHIVSTYAGQFRIESTVGHGTQIFVWLPDTKASLLSET